MQVPIDCLNNVLDKNKIFLGVSSKEIHNEIYKEFLLPIEVKQFENLFSHPLVHRNEKKYTSSFPYLTKRSKIESKKCITASDICENTNLDLEKDEEIISYLCDGNLNQPYSLKLLDYVDHLVYKDKIFSLKAEIVDIYDNKITLKKPIMFTVSLFTTTNPIQFVERTKHNDKIITGITICESSDTVYFKKLAIREVSFYQPHGIFNLIIIPNDVKLIKPFVIRNMKVKSRKSRLWELKKKLKITE